VICSSCRSASSRSWRTLQPTRFRGCCRRCRRCCCCSPCATAVSAASPSAPTTPAPPLLLLPPATVSFPLSASAPSPSTSPSACSGVGWWGSTGGAAADAESDGEPAEAMLAGDSTTASTEKRFSRVALLRTAYASSMPWPGRGELRLIIPPIVPAAEPGLPPPTVARTSRAGRGEGERASRTVPIAPIGSSPPSIRQRPASLSRPSLRPWPWPPPRALRGPRATFALRGAGTQRH
jgi:hypothetical protein